MVDDLDRFVILFALAAVVVAIVMTHGRKPVVGNKTDPDIPHDRLNVSKRHNYGLSPGPAYLLSNLPAWRHSNDTPPLAADGSTLVSRDGEVNYAG